MSYNKKAVAAGIFGGLMLIGGISNAMTGGTSNNESPAPTRITAAPYVAPYAASHIGSSCETLRANVNELFNEGFTAEDILTDLLAQGLSLDEIQSALDACGS